MSSLYVWVELDPICWLILQIRVGYAQSKEQIIFLSANASSSPDMNISDCFAVNTQFTITDTSLSPLSASFKTFIADYFDVNQTLVYQAAVEFPPLTITPGAVIALIIGCVVGKIWRGNIFDLKGFLALVGLVVAAVYYYRKTKREEKKRWEDFKNGNEEHVELSDTSEIKE
jgi:hypothetical protein